MGGRVGDLPGVVRTNTRATEGEGAANVESPAASDPIDLASKPAPVGWVGGAGNARPVAAVGAVAEQPPQPARPLAITGELTFGAGGPWSMKAENGNTIAVVPGDRNVNPIMNLGWARAFEGEGPVTVRGQLSADGKKFMIEDYCPGTSDQYVYGRVDEAAIKSGKVVIGTPRGDVEVTNPQLKQKLLLAPRLGVILPGNPQMKDGKLVYEGNPARYYGLARARAEDGSTPHPKEIDGKPGHTTFNGDLAYSFFQNKPINLSDPSDAARINHLERLWLLGDFKLTDDGKSLASFDASYASKSTKDALDAPQGTTPKDDTQAASLLGALGFKQQSRPIGVGFSSPRELLMPPR